MSLSLLKSIACFGKACWLVIVDSCTHWYFTKIKINTDSQWSKVPSLHITFPVNKQKRIIILMIIMTVMIMWPLDLPQEKCGEVGTSISTLSYRETSVVMMVKMMMFSRLTLSPLLEHVVNTTYLEWCLIMRL
jgi:hypothetical protein